MNTINPATGRKIKINGSMYKKLSKIYYTTSNGQLTDQIKPSLKEYSETNHTFTQAYNKFNIPETQKDDKFRLTKDDWLSDSDSDSDGYSIDGDLINEWLYDGDINF